MSDYTVKNKILAELAKAEATGGNPEIGPVVAADAAAKAEADTQARTFSSTIDLEKAKMAESGRQADEKMAMAREMLDTWSKNNKWATKIAAGGVLTTAGAAYQESGKQEAREQLQKEQNATLQGIAKNYIIGQQAETKKFRDLTDINDTTASYRANSGLSPGSLSSNTPAPKRVYYTEPFVPALQ